MHLSLWLTGASAVYLGIGCLVAMHTHQLYSITPLEWAKIMLVWPMVFVVGF